MPPELLAIARRDGGPIDQLHRFDAAGDLAGERRDLSAAPGSQIQTNASRGSEVIVGLLRLSHSLRQQRQPILDSHRSKARRELSSLSLKPAAVAGVPRGDLSLLCDPA